MEELTPLQIDKLQQLLGDELLLNAIKNVFNNAIERNKPEVGLTSDNELLGQKYRAYSFGKELIAIVFTDLMSYKKEHSQQNQSLNKAR